MRLDTDALLRQREWITKQAGCEESDGLIDLIDNLLMAQKWLDKLLLKGSAPEVFERVVRRVDPAATRRGL